MAKLKIKKAPSNRSAPNHTKVSALKAVQPLLGGYQPNVFGLRRLRGCLVGTFIVDDEHRLQILSSPEIVHRLDTAKIKYRDIVCGPSLEAFLDYKIAVDETSGGNWLVNSSLRRRKKIQGRFVPLHYDGTGQLTEALAVVLACQSASGAIVGHLSYWIQAVHDGDKSKVTFLVEFSAIYVRPRWRRQGYGNDLIVAAAFIAEDCPMAAFRALSKTSDIQVYFCCEALSVGGLQCAKHFSNYLQFNVIEGLREGAYGIDFRGCELRYDEDIG